MKKKFAFLLMGKEFDTAKDTAVFETEHMISYIFTVTSFEEALKRAVACARTAWVLSRSAERSERNGPTRSLPLRGTRSPWAMSSTTRSRMSYSGSSSPRHDRSA